MSLKIQCNPEKSFALSNQAYKKYMLLMSPTLLEIHAYYRLNISGLN